MTVSMTQQLRSGSCSVQQGAYDRSLTSQPKVTSQWGNTKTSGSMTKDMIMDGEDSEEEVRVIPKRNGPTHTKNLAFTQQLLER